MVDECHRATGEAQAHGGRPLLSVAMYPLGHSVCVTTVLCAAGPKSATALDLPLTAPCAPCAPGLRPAGGSEIVQAVKQMRADKCRFRVLGLSATPGADGGKVQEVINNLMVAAIEFRTEQVGGRAPGLGGWVAQRELPLLWRPQASAAARWRRRRAPPCSPGRSPHLAPGSDFCHPPAPQDPDVAPYTHPKDIQGSCKACRRPAPPACLPACRCF